MAESDATPPPEQSDDRPRRAKKRLHRRHSWPQRLLLSVNILVVLACFGGAAGLLYARSIGNSLVKVDIQSPAAASSTQPVVATTSAPGDTAAPDGTDPASTASTAPPETFPPADPNAQNFLITGADNDSCIDPASPYAGAFGDRTSMGERSDTVMILRLDPSAKRAAILSFPRDLWVTIAGKGGKQRINTAYVKDDPQRLIDTIYQNFGVGVDHYIQIDFCAFQTIVDSIPGGVGVPFEYPTRDRNTGLNITEPGCVFFKGDEALAYVRSRHYQYFQDGVWKTDPVSDLGRISRQQDFIRRVLSAALDQNLFNVDFANAIIEAAQNNVVFDSGLTIADLLEFVGVVRDIDPGAIATYQIEAYGRTISGQSVLEPKINGDNMQLILSIFKGEKPLAEAPQQVFETTTTTSTTTTSTTVAPTTTRPGATTTSGSATTTTSTSTSTTTTVAPTTTVETPEENNQGIIPPRAVECTQ